MVLDPNEMLNTAFQPVVANQFIFYVDGIPSYMIHKASAPGFDDGEIKIEHINTYRKLRGKRLWDDITLQLYDPIVPSGRQAVMEWARLAMESVTGRAGYSDFYKKDCTLDIVGPVGDIIGEFILKGAFIKTAKFGEFDWGTADPINVDLTLAIDYAIINF